MANAFYFYSKHLTSILLHDLSLLCSIITSHTLYFSYFLFFSRHVIKLITFISPLLISTVFISLLLTTAFCPNFPQLELGILHTVVQHLNSNFDQVTGDETDRYFKDFEICRIVFDRTFTITICDEDEPVTKKLLEHSVHGGRRNDKLGFEKLLEHSVHGGRKHDASVSDSETVELGFEKLLERSVHCCRKIDSDTVKLGSEKKLLERSVHGGRRNDALITDFGTVQLGFEKLLEHSVNGERRYVASVSDADSDNLGFEKLLERSVHGGRRSEASISDSDTVKLGFEKIPKNYDDIISDSESVKLGFEKLLERSVHGGIEKELGFEKLMEELDGFEDFTTAIETDKAVMNLSDNDECSRSYSVRSSSLRSNSSIVVNAHGSVREEKDWRRTLACKLLEERHNSSGGEEGMDSLWEAYENDKVEDRKEVMINKMMMIEKEVECGGIKTFDHDDNDDDEGNDDEDDEDEMSYGPLCCLQALRISTRKMNMGMGMGTSNFVKISKAFKGFGWMHYVKKKDGKRG